MSDGMTDASRAASRAAEKFAKAQYPGVKRVMHWSHAPATGTVVVIYEEWLAHIVELVDGRVVKERWLISSYSEPVRMTIGDRDWRVGHYRDERIKDKIKLRKGGKP